MQVKLALADRIGLNQPLPWDMLDGQGALLLRKGTVPTDRSELAALIERGAYVDQDAYEHYRQAPQTVDPFQQWDDIYYRLGHLLRHHESEPRFVDRLTQLATEIRALITRDADAAIFAMARLEQSNYAITHTLQVAVCCDIYGQFLLWKMSDRAAAIHACLTMNIAMLDLQTALNNQLEPPTLEQREQIHNHPIHGCELLRKLGVADERWLQAIAEHHECSDGKGYPAGLTNVSSIAELIHLADCYCALMSSRRTRGAKLPDHAARELYTKAPGKLQAVAASMIKAFGGFPPGYFVKLANGEIAVVVNRTERATKPFVATLISADGLKLADPIQRNTADPRFAVTDAVAETGIDVHIDPAKLFGYKD